MFYEVRSMSTATSAPPDCEVRSVIHFLTIEKGPGAEIYHRLCAAYGEANIMLHTIYGKFRH